jgi:hypothetical protein
MNENGTTKIVRYSSDALPPDDETDWAKVMTMTDEEIHARALAQLYQLARSNGDFWGCRP